MNFIMETQQSVPKFDINCVTCKFDINYVTV